MSEPDPLERWAQTARDRMVPAGFAELDFRGLPSAELLHFGLIPEFIGQGLGPRLLQHTIEAAWARATERFWLHTCSLDHPKAIIDKPLDLRRKIVGWIGLVVFIISFTPRPLYFEINEKAQIERPGLEEKDVDPSKVITRRMVKVF